jgi:RND family efflux transporter MFP subunit
MSDPLADEHRSSPHSRVRLYALLAAFVALVLAVWGIASRVSARNTLADETASAAIPTVTTVKPSRAAGAETLVLTGNVQAFYEAPIYARTSGYLKSWLTDIGTRVKKGQVLAEIDTPEVDQQLLQAQADLATAQANYQLAKTTDERWQGLLATESVSKQDADQRAGDAAAKRAAVESAAANVARLRELETFKRVVAPFDGVVTQRNTDIGSLITSGQSTTPELFHVADTHRLRIYVAVPQSFAAAVARGLTADLTFVERPGKTYPATVAFTSEALDASTRTLQVELQLDNATGELLPGSYAQVHMSLPAPSGTLRIPVNALLFRSGGLLIATVDKDNHVTLKKISQGRDFGTEVEVLAGLGTDDDVIVNPPDSVTNGATVRVVGPQNSATTAGRDHP